jgi:hypothetical protein
VRILLIGEQSRLGPLASVLHTEGARVHCQEPEALSEDLGGRFKGFDAVVIEDIARAAKIFDFLRAECPAALRVLMVGDGAARERDEETLYELLFPSKWSRAEARILCAWVRQNTRRGEAARKQK